MCQVQEGSRDKIQSKKRQGPWCPGAASLVGVSHHYLTIILFARVVLQL
jgi:hypothetical protein